MCFDTGGLNLKPTGSIENMHKDKGGAAAVLAAADVIATRRAKVNAGSVSSLPIFLSTVASLPPPL